MEVLHLDLLQGPCVALGTGFDYILVIVDDYSRMAWYIGLTDDDIPEAWRNWYTMINFQYKDTRIYEKPMGRYWDVAAAHNGLRPQPKRSG
jgi:hypothetical protein